MLANLSIRLLAHELRRGELTIMLLAVVLAVSSVFALTSFSEALQGVVTEQSRQFLAADRVLHSNKEIDESWLQQAKSQQLQISKQIRFGTMLYFNDEMKLSQVKAVDDLYPLKGKIDFYDSVWGNIIENTKKIKPGEVWLSSDLYHSLNIKVGDLVEIGEAQFIASQILASTPDQGFSPFTNNHEVLMQRNDIGKTEVIQAGSRIGYRYAMSGNEANLNQFEDWLVPLLNRDLHHWATLKDDSMMGNALKTAERFFLLASLLSIILAATAIGVAAKRYAERHYDAVAVLKTIGASKKQVMTIFSWHLFILLTIGLLIGITIGYMGRHIAFYLIQDQLPLGINDFNISLRPLGLSMVTGIICGGLFALAPLVSLFKIPPLRVFQRQLDASDKFKILAYILSSLSIFLLMWLYSQNLYISVILFLSSGLAVALLWGLSMLSFWTSRKVGSRASSAWKLAVARIIRRGKENSLQLIGFTIAVKLFLIVIVIRGDLIGQWQQQLADGTPNNFVVNVPEQQTNQLQADFEQAGITIDNMYPVIRGRLVAVNGEKLNTRVSKDKQNVEEERQKLSIGRELNLTYTQQLPKENKIIKGQWWAEHPNQKLQISVEEKLAEGLGINLQDTLSFMVAGSSIDVTVTSIRSVNWQSMTPNFYMIFSEDVLNTLSATYIGSFYLPEQLKPQLAKLMAPYSSTSVIDLTAIFAQVQAISSQASMAVEFIFILVLIAGVLVLVAQIQASMGERKEELLVLRMLGCKGKIIKQSIMFEFILLGAMAGLFAAILTEAGVWALQTLIFKMQWQFHYEFWLLAPIGSALVLAVMGGLSCASLLRHSVHQQKRVLE